MPLTEDTLFRLTTKKFVKSVGGPTLLPVPNVQASHRLSPLSIVVKRPNRKWYRRTKYDYFIKETKVTQLLEDKSDLDVEMKEIKNYINNCRDSDCTDIQATAGFSIIQKILSIRGSCAKYKCHNYTSGRMKENGVGKRDLLEALKDRKIDVKDPEIAQIIKASQDSVLCVVVSVIRTTERVDITQETKIAVKGEMKLDVPDGIQELSVFGGKQSCPKLSINPTVVAYDVCELEVDMKTGEIDVLLEPELRGGFVNLYSQMDTTVNNGCMTPYESYMRALYETLQEMSAEDRNTVREVVMMSANDADIICHLLYQPVSYQDTDDSGSEKDLTDSVDSMSISSSSASSGSEPTSPSNDDVTTLLHQTEPDTDSDECGLERSILNMSISSCSSSAGDDYEPTTPSSNGDVTPTIPSDTFFSANEMNNQLQTIDTNILSLTTKEQAFRRMLELIGWSLRKDGTMVKPNDKPRMDLFECFFVLLKRLHQEDADTIHNITSLSSRAQNQLREVYRHKLVPSELFEDGEQLGDEIEEEEMNRLTELGECLKRKEAGEISHMPYAICSMLLALS